MFRSVLASRRLRAGPHRPGEQHRHGGGRITGAICAAVAAGIALTTAGLAGAAVPAMAATRSLGPPEYSSAWVGYGTGGRWFRYVSTTVTVPPQVVPPSPGAPSQRGDAMIWLNGIGSVVPTQITVAPGGGPVSWGDPGGSGTFRISPHIGDRLTLSIYYDQHGDDYLTATDSTQHTTQTVRTNVPTMTYLHARLFAWVYNDVTPPLADTPLWQFTDSRVTTYSGDHGTIAGPWTTSKTIVSTASTASGTVIASPSGLSNSGQDFTAWFRALPLTYSDSFAGYQVGGGRWFRYVATTVTILPPAQPAGNGGTAAISLGHNGGPTPRPYARIEVRSGGGPGSVRYDTSTGTGTFTLSPQPGDQVTISIYYDQHGRNYLGLTLLNRGTSQTITNPASPLIASMPYNNAWIAAMIDNTAVTPPPADTRIWAFTGTRITTYSGDRGTIMGPWATSEYTDTTTGTAAGKPVMNAPVLWNGAQNFGAWLRHQ
jgi:hypothetical protein